MDYTVGNTDGISRGSDPGLSNVMEAIKAGKAQLVDAYPYSYVKNGYWATGYSDTPRQNYIDPLTGDVPQKQQMLLMDGKIYAPGNDWIITPIMHSYAVGSGEDAVTVSEPTGNYRIRSRADGDVFNEFVFQAGGDGKITAYNPNVFSTGSNKGGFFGSSLPGEFLNDLVTMAQQTSNVWMPAVTGQITSGLGGVLDSITGAGGSEALNAATSGLQDVYGGVLPIDQIAAGVEGITPELVSVGTGITTPDITATQIPSVTPSVVQPDYLAADAAASQNILQDPFAYTTEDVTNPLADTTATSTTPKLPEVTTTSTATPTEAPNLEGGDLGMTEVQAQEQFYKDIGIDPTTLKDLPPASTAEINQILQGGTNAITPSDINKIRSIISTANTAKNVLASTGLLGGAAGALAGAAAVGALTGGGYSTTPAPVSQAGTYSGTANYSPEYYQQIQQNYNRLFPTAPSDITTPLQSWYATKFVPDTNISQKLFGV